MSDIEDNKKNSVKKVAVVRKALVATVCVFFFAVILFIGIVVLIAKFASKAH
ncbi:MAG TPA: hypothetical protein VJB65_03950 [Patescibacteria group bacterium]|nr:hypothetical protein [Patescibacteria group bacterium]